MALYRDAGIVLRAQKLGEADRIVTLLTRRHGKVRAVAKGVRRTRSRFGARLEPFMIVDVQLYEGRSLDTVTQAETIAPYGDPIARDYVAYTAATAMLETADRLTQEREPVVQQFLLLAGGLSARLGWCWTHTCCGRWPSRVGRRAFTTVPGVARPGPSVPSTLPAAGLCARPAGRPDRRSRRWPPSSCWRLCSPATGASPTRACHSIVVRVTVWSPPSCSGISSVASAPCD